MNYQRDENRVYRIVYDLAWTPKRRKSVLVGAIATDCRRLIENRCEERGWVILDLEIFPDQVRVLVQVWPSTSAAEVVKECKGVTSRELRHKYPVLMKLPSLWTRSYFAATVGDISRDAIDRFVASQKGI